MLVGKILTIPVDKSDRSKLYHLTSETEVMYGPSDEFDVMKKVPAQTTVRLTGMTPDNVWYRIMIDNGEMGFVKKSALRLASARISLTAAPFIMPVINFVFV